MSAQSLQYGSPNAADLTALGGGTFFKYGHVVFLAGITTFFDGKGGVFFFDPNSTATPGDDVLIPDDITTSSPGRFLRYNKLQSAIVTRSFNTSFQPNTLRDIRGNYTVAIEVTSTLLGTNSGTVFLEISPDNTNWTTVAQVGLQISGVVATTQNTYGINGFIPRGYYARLRTATSGANGATFTSITGEEQSL